MIKNFVEQVELWLLRVKAFVCFAQGFAEILASIFRMQNTKKHEKLKTGNSKINRRSSGTSWMARGVGQIRKEVCIVYIYENQKPKFLRKISSTEKGKTHEEELSFRYLLLRRSIFSFFYIFFLRQDEDGSDGKRDDVKILLSPLNLLKICIQ